MQVLIVVPKFWEGTFIHYDFPLGLAYISAVLKQHGHQTSILNLNKYYGDQRCENWAALRALVRRRLETKPFDVVCVGGISPHYDKVKAVVETVRAFDSKIVTIIGGGLVSSEPELICNDIQPDFGVVGEGEETIVELMERLFDKSMHGDIHGILYRKDGRWIQTPTRKPIADLGVLPYPDYDGFEVEHYLDAQLPMDLHGYFVYDKPRAMPLVASRSCPFKCSFCFHPIGDVYRQRPMDSIFKELDFLVERYQINTVLFYDELFGFKRDWLIEFCRRFAQYRLALAVQLHVSQADEESIKLLKDAGCVYISYGLESASDRVLKSMNKRASIAQMEKALELTRRAGIQIQGNFLFGEKAETRETAAETLDWWRKHKKYAIHLSRVQAYPGSQLWSHAIEKGYIRDKLDFIRDACSRLSGLNLTSLSQRELDDLYLLTEELAYGESRIPAVVLDCREEGFLPKKGILYSLKIQCPHCGQTMVYRNMHVLRGWHGFQGNRLGCRVCNQRFDILPFKMERALVHILENTNLRVGLMPACRQTTELLKFSLPFRQRTTCVVDDLFFSGLKTIEGVRVVPLTGNIDGLRSSLDAILLTNDEALCASIDYVGTLAKGGLTCVRLSQLSNALANTFLNEMIGSGGNVVAQKQAERLFHHYLSEVAETPAFVAGHVALADVALALRDFRVALDAIDTATALSPENQELLHKRDQIFRAYNRVSEAMQNKQSARDGDRTSHDEG